MEPAEAPDPGERPPEEHPESCKDVPIEGEKPGNPCLDGWDSVAKAIASTLGSVIQDFDTRAETVAKSQDEVSLALDRLAAELDKLLEEAPVPFIMQHAVKIASVRRRVLAMNSVLNSIQRRIDNVDRLISNGSSHGTEMKTSKSS